MTVTLFPVFPLRSCPTFLSPPQNPSLLFLSLFFERCIREFTIPFSTALKFVQWPYSSSLTIVTCPLGLVVLLYFRSAIRDVIKTGLFIFRKNARPPHFIPPGPLVLLRFSGKSSLRPLHGRVLFLPYVLPVCTLLLAAIFWLSSLLRPFPLFLNRMEHKALAPTPPHSFPCISKTLNFRCPPKALPAALSPPPFQTRSAMDP